MQPLKAQPELAAGAFEEKLGHTVSVLMPWPWPWPGPELQLKAFDSAPELRVSGKYDGFPNRNRIGPKPND